MMRGAYSVKLKSLWIILFRVLKICPIFVYKLKLFFLYIYCRSFVDCVGPGIKVAFYSTVSVIRCKGKGHPGTGQKGP